MEAKNDYPKGGNQLNLPLFASLVSGILLLATGFFAGWYWQNSAVQDLVRVEIVEKSTPSPQETAVVVGEEKTENESVPEENCPFVGSKNSDKFHIPDSAPAKRIKPENRVCFVSEEEALEEGYEAGTIE